MKKRVKEEAQSITANCNIKIFGKLEDPTETKEFFEKRVGSAMVTEVSGFQMTGGSEMGSYFDTQQAGVQLRPRAQYEDLRGFKEGQAVITFGEAVVDCAVFYSNPGFAKAMRVTRFMALPPTDEAMLKSANQITKVRDLLTSKSWTAERADVAVETPPEIEAMVEGLSKFKVEGVSAVERGIASIVEVHALNNPIEPAEAPPATTDTKVPAAPSKAPPPPPSEAPKSPPAASAPPPAAPEQKPADAAKGTGETSGSPMGFFGNSDADDKASKAEAKPAPVAPPPAPAGMPPAAAPSKPIETPAQKEARDKEATNWQNIVESAKAEPSAEVPETPIAPEAKEPEKPAKLPKEIEDILEAASKDAKKAIFKDSEDIDAAE